MVTRARRLTAEFLGSLLLAAVVVGSGVAAQQLSPTDAGLELLENAFATALGLYVLIVVLAPISGAHLNPVISLVDATLRRRAWSDAFAYIPAQFAGCAVGAILSNLMFGASAVSISARDRLNPGHFLGEVIATAGLVLVVFVLAATDRSRFAPVAVGAYIGAAYFFTSSSSFANPAITAARVLTNSFSGISPASAIGFVVAQLIGAAIGVLIVLALAPGARLGSSATDA